MGYALYAQGPDGNWYRLLYDLLPDPTCVLEHPDPTRVRRLAVRSVIAGGVESAFSDPIDPFENNLRVEGPYPQPVTSSCRFRISVPDDLAEDATVRVEILSLNREREALLYDGRPVAGSIVEVSWDRRVASGKAAAPGYHYVLLRGGAKDVLKTIYLAP